MNPQEHPGTHRNPKETPGTSNNTFMLSLLRECGLMRPEGLRRPRLPPLALALAGLGAREETVGSGRRVTFSEQTTPPAKTCRIDL